MKLVFDIKQKRPACALLQVLLGGDLGIANKFVSESWLLNPTSDMKVYQITKDQLDEVISKVNTKYLQKGLS